MDLSCSQQSLHFQLEVETPLTPPPIPGGAPGRAPAWRMNRLHITRGHVGPLSGLVTRLLCVVHLHHPPCQSLVEHVHLHQGVKNKSFCDAAFAKEFVPWLRSWIEGMQSQMLVDPTKFSGVNLWRDTLTADRLFPGFVLSAA